MTKLDRISVDPKRMNGQPSIRTLRFTVRRVIELLALYSDRDELRLEYPELEDEDVRQSLLFAATSLEHRVEYITEITPEGRIDLPAAEVRIVEGG